MFHFPYIVLLQLSWKEFYVVILCDLRQKKKLGRQGDIVQQETINNIVRKTGVHRKASFAYTSYFLPLKRSITLTGTANALVLFSAQAYQCLAVFMTAGDAY